MSGLDSGLRVSAPRSQQNSDISGGFVSPTAKPEFDLAGSLPFSIANGGELCVFGNLVPVEGKPELVTFVPTLAHAVIYGFGYNTTLKMEIGRRYNGTETRLPYVKANEMMKNLGILAIPPSVEDKNVNADGTRKVEANEYGEYYTVVMYKRPRH